jgi:release factor glutamine methyltransferase
MIQELKKNLEKKAMNQTLKYMLPQEFLNHKCVPIQHDILQEWIERRCSGEPLSRILGNVTFRELSLILLKNVFEPRPETELIIDLILPHMSSTSTIIEVGVGTGAILLSLLKEGPQGITGLGIDISPQAIKNLHLNAFKNDLNTKYYWYEGSYKDFPWKEHQCDIFVSNPPYIPSNHIKDLPPEVTLWDPVCALDGGESGLDAYEFLIKNSFHTLRSGGWMWFEHGWDQGQAVRDLLIKQGLCHVLTHQDFELKERFSGGKKIS